VSDRTNIADLDPSQYLEGVYAIQNCQLGQTKAGKPFLKCLLADSTGRTPGRMWNASQQLFSELPTDGFVEIKGQTQPYQGEVQIIIQAIRAVEPTPEILLELLPRTTHDIDVMWDELVALMGSIKHMPLRYLAEAYFKDEELMERLRTAPAAQTMHHAYLGGLLEHTLNLLKLADASLPLYPQVNRDVVLMGLFLHDLGKTQELVWETGFGYSDRGHLVGHIAQGAIWLQQKADTIAAEGHALTDELLMVLQHIILSHHGKPEFGAQKIPATPEAIFVSLLDNVDAKMQMAIAAADRESEPKDEKLGGTFTEKIWALETRVYRPDVATD